MNARRGLWLAFAVVLAAVLALVAQPSSAQGGIEVEITSDGPFAPGAEISVVVAGDGLTDIGLAQCRTGTDICEYRGSRFAQPGERSVAASVVVRRNLIAPTGQADCGRVECEIRAINEAGGEGRAAIAVDPAVPIVKPVVEVSPSVDLVDRASVTITGRGYDPFVSVVFYQCTLLMCGDQSEYAFFGEGGEAQGEITLPVSRMVGGLDCAEVPCFVLAFVDGNADHLTGAFLRFDPSAPLAPPAVVEIDPSTALLDRNTVTIRGSSFAAGESLLIRQCVMASFGDRTCVFVDSGRAGPDGTFETTTIVYRRVGAADCAEVGCEIMVDGAFGTARAALEFDASVPPPPLPRLDVTPDRDLVDGQAVDVEIVDGPPGDTAAVQQCGPSGRCLRTVFFDAGEPRSIVVLRDIADEDCAVVECRLEVQLFGPGSFSFSTPLHFDPDAPRLPPPSLRVVPATGLWDAQQIDLDIRDVVAVDTVLAAQCLAGATTPTPCGERDYLSLRQPIAPSTTAHRSLAATSGTYDCAAVACEIVLFDFDGNRLAGAPISFGEPRPIGDTYPGQLECAAWPTGGWDQGPVPAGVDAAELQAAIDRMLATGTRSVVVVHGGRLVAEGYDDGVGPDAENISYSVAKTFIGTLIGTVVDDGALTLDGPLPVPEWSAPGDPRQAITLRHLMHMASGLEWDESYSFELDTDIVQMIIRDDSAGYVAEKPLEHEPGTVFNYSTGTSHILGRLLSVGLDLYDDELRDEMDRRLFDRLGMEERLVMDGDGYWMPGRLMMTTREFAKFGLLHLRGGEWDGEQVVSREWIDFMHAPSPAYDGYAGQIWRRGGFVEMVGLYGQKVTVRPDLDLVVAANTEDLQGGAGTEEIVALFERAAPATCDAEPVTYVVDDTATVAPGGSVTVDVLANDPGGRAEIRVDTLTVVEDPAVGTAEVVDGVVRYVAPEDAGGAVEIPYLVCTTAPFCTTATLTVTIDPAAG